MTNDKVTEKDKNPKMSYNGDEKKVFIILADDSSGWVWGKAYLSVVNYDSSPPIDTAPIAANKHTILKFHQLIKYQTSNRFNCLCLVQPHRNMQGLQFLVRYIFAL